MAAVVSYMAKLLRLQRSDLLRFATSIAAYFGTVPVHHKSVSVGWALVDLEQK